VTPLLLASALLVGSGGSITISREPVAVPKYERFDGRCPVCRAHEMRSVVQEYGCVSTLLSSTAYYDTAGRFHLHDPNSTTCDYRCSRGHWFRVVYRPHPEPPELLPQDLGDFPTNLPKSLGNGE